MPRFCAGSRLPALPLSCRFLAPILPLPNCPGLNWQPLSLPVMCAFNSFFSFETIFTLVTLGCNSRLQIASSTYFLPLSCPGLNWQPLSLPVMCVFNSFLTLKPFSHWSHLGATVLQIASSTYFLPLSYPGLNWQPLSLFPSPRLLLPKAPRSFHSFQLFEGFSSFLTTTITFGEIDWSLDSPEQCETSYFMFLFKTPLFNLKHHASCFFKKSLWHSQPI